ncbi:MAG: helix-turn-helix transcriptional regulator [Clostridiales bacterium]|nr:helix-turn-helix transcriptional regulator [Clostridiales bacterium]
MEDKEFGLVRICLDEAIKKSGLSKNKVAQRAQMQRTQLNNYCKGNVQRFDMAILSRLCYALNCTPGDILVYMPPDDKA